VIQPSPRQGAASAFAKATADKSADKPPPTRIGVFGGTFDPIHIGHLRAAEEFAGLARLDRVLLVPSARPPHRDEIPFAAPEERLEMVRLAVRGNPLLDACPLEVRRGGPSFTVDTLGELGRKMPEARLVLAMGADAWLEFGGWNRPGEIAALADIVVLTRPGSPAPDLPGGPLASLPPALRAAWRREGDLWLHRSGKTLTVTQVTPLDVSASRVRALAAEGRSIRYLVPDRVLTFIKSRGLYRPVPDKENA
jgi:nicotinate-nucleotide adenylyltransferase